MPDHVEQRLAELGLSLPEAASPVANYVPFVQSGKLLHVSGQIAMRDGKMVEGKLGETMSVEDGTRAAELCGLSLLAQVRAACGGDFENLVRVVKLVGFVNSTPDFGDQPKVINGVSDLMVNVLGDRGRHARSAVSVASLPFGVAVEVDGVFELA